MPAPELRAHPDPCPTYAASLARVEALCAQDTAEVNPLCRTTLLTHGRRTGRAIVFWHGYTNCPRQFHTLAERFFENGYNVFIPRLPLHGMADRMTDTLVDLTTEALLAAADTSIDIACGLGEQVTVAGLSASGVMAAWAAHERAEVERAVIIAPGFAFKLVPAPLTRLVTRVARALPNRFIWWDPRARASSAGPLHAYPRFSTHALAEFNRIAFDVQDRVRQAKPLARSLLVILNERDPAVDNEVTLDLVRRWREWGAEVRVYTFPAGLKLMHDLIDPDQPAAQIDVVYPKLIELMEA